jgi:hypothetical protein
MVGPEQRPTQLGQRIEAAVQLAASETGLQSLVRSSDGGRAVVTLGADRLMEDRAQSTEYRLLLAEAVRSVAEALQLRVGHRRERLPVHPIGQVALCREPGIHPGVAARARVAGASAEERQGQQQEPGLGRSDHPGWHVSRVWPGAVPLAIGRRCSRNDRRARGARRFDGQESGIVTPSGTARVDLTFSSRRAVDSGLVASRETEVLRPWKPWPSSRRLSSAGSIHGS